jgi:hypothetical protein
VRDARLFRDVPDAGGVVALLREHTHGRVQDEPPLVLLGC